MHVCVCAWSILNVDLCGLIESWYLTSDIGCPNNSSQQSGQLSHLFPSPITIGPMIGGPSTRSPKIIATFWSITVISPTARLKVLICEDHLSTKAVNKWWSRGMKRSWLIHCRLTASSPLMNHLQVTGHSFSISKCNTTSSIALYSIRVSGSMPST